jgi:large subunit ribosomal protein L17|tara:strand:- start:11558 stop:11977 length:420 start_codon:yes stop_codon:yes gene_type:complete
MRHKIKGRKLNRNSSHRKALFRNMCNSLFTNELIRTTLPKAKEIRSIAEKIITISRNDNLSNRRRVISITNDVKVTNKLFLEIGKIFKDRKGGYLRILKNGFRTGDKAPMAIIELVEKTTQKEEVKVADKKKVETKKKS